MKTNSLTLAIFLLIASISNGFCADPLSETFRKGLFEEEANQNLQAAIEAYESVLTQIDAQRKIAATTVFRLGECYRKLGRTNDAVAQYQRIVREFADQDVLANLSRQNLVGLGIQDEAEAAKQPNLLDLVLPDKETTEIARLKELITHSPDLMNTPDPKANRQTPLQTAAQNGQLQVARFLLENQADVDAMGSAQKTPLHFAADAAHNTMVELLLEHGAEVEARNSSAYTPLLSAVRKGYRAVVETLIAAKANINVNAGNHTIDDPGNLSGTTPLGIAAFRNDLPMLNLLLAREADANIDEGGGVTPLHVAAYHSRNKICDVLLRNAAKVEATIDARIVVSIDLRSRYLPYRGRDRYKAIICQGFTPLHLAALNATADTVKSVITSGANVNAKGQNEETPLHLAIDYGSLDVVRLLLEAGADVDAIQSNRGLSPLHKAVNRGSEELVQIILDFEPDLEARDGNQVTPLVYAVSRQNIGIARKILEVGANPNAILQNGRTLLHMAILNRDMQMVEALLAHKANVSAIDDKGKTALDYTKPESQSQTVGVRAGPPGPPRRAQILYPGQSIPIPKAPPSDLADLLRQAGAQDDPRRSNQIRIGRQGVYAPVFYKGRIGSNRHSVFELIATYFDQLKPIRIGGGLSPTETFPLRFPDFANVVIRRSAGGEEREIQVDLEAAIRQADCSGDVSLVWGDIVEVPEKEHKLNEVWNGLGNDIWENLRNSLTRSVRISIKGEWNTVSLTPFTKTESNRSKFQQRYQQLKVENVRRNLIDTNSAVVRSFPETTDEKSKSITVGSFWLKEVLIESNLLLTSSDITRVKVNRVDPITEEQVEIVLNLEKVDPKTDLWLRDGDVIEVPEKE